VPWQDLAVERPGRMQHQPALDGLRGAAVAGVLLFHAGHLRGGYLGVDAFFVLSGFLITSLLLAEGARTGTVALGAFWARRARRLLPALLAVLAFVAVYALVVASATERTTIRADGLATLGYFANWRAIFSGTDYWALFQSPSPLEHTWSLAIEEQFYLFWPLLLVAIAAVPRRVLALAGGLAIASFVWMQILYDPASPSRVYFGTDTRLASILVGAALAAWIAVRGHVARGRPRATLEVAAWASIALLGFAWLRIDGSSTTLYRGGLFVTAIAVACVIAAAVHPQRGFVGRALSFGPLCALGLISYGVYLWHWPIYVWLDEQRTHLGGWTLVALRVGVTIAIATISYFLLEQPIRHGAIPARVLRPAVPALVGALVVGLVFATTSSSREERVVADPIRIATPQPDVERVLVVGNSVALFLADEGFKPLHTNPRIDVLNRGRIGCTIVPIDRVRDAHGEILHVPATWCRKDWDEAEAAFRPDLVVLTFAEPTDSQAEIDGSWTAPCEPLYDSKLEAELHDAIHLFASGGAHVVLTTAAYANYPMKTPDWFHHNDCQNAIIRRVVASEPKAMLADLFAWYCGVPETECRNTVDGVQLRPDAVHYRGRGAEIVAKRILRVAGIATGAAARSHAR
jgi:peptidoglycan/LPS O-acetylase OafA/YrhL